MLRKSCWVRGWLNTVLANGTLGEWQALQDPEKWPAGGVWQTEQAFVVVLWSNTVFANGTAGVWHPEHVGPKCFAGALWHEAQSVPAGCVKTNFVPG